MCVFEREHHRRIAAVLDSLDPLRLVAQGCLFGGGTAMALRYGEYRESVDIDFLVSHAEGYRQLRQWVGGPEGINALTKPGRTLQQAREMRTDQYGLRTVLWIDATPIKFEIVREARIMLSAPAPEDRVCDIAALTPLDMVASKLLANADRGADDAVFSRDLIDLAMMAPSRPLLQRATAKARVAYGDAIELDLHKAIDRLRQRPLRLDECMQALKITTVPKAVLWMRIKSLVPRKSASRP